MMDLENKKKISKISIYLTFFIDNLSWSIVFPIFAPLFLDKQNLLFSESVPVEMRTALLGVFLMAYPLAQFFGAPLIGDYADAKGRKKALVVTIFFTVIGLALTAWSIKEHWLVILFISRFFTGVFAGNLSVCLAAVADLSKDEHQKIKNFGNLAVVAGLSFIVGAFLGGKFSDPSIHPFFTPAFPLWLASLFTLVNLIFVYFGFMETSHVNKSVKFDLLEGFYNIKQALKIEKIKSIYLIYFLFLFSWTLLFQFIPVYFVKFFSFTNSQIGDVAAFMGISWAIGSGYLSKLLLRWFKDVKVLEISLLGFTILCSFIVFPKTVLKIFIIIGLCVALAGIAWPICTGIISNRAGKKAQGKILGMSQSMQSLAMAVSPIIGGLLDFIHFNTIFYAASFASFLAALLYYKIKL